MSIEKQPENGLGSIYDLQLNNPTELGVFDFLVYNLYEAPKTLFFSMWLMSIEKQPENGLGSIQNLQLHTLSSMSLISLCIICMRPKKKSLIALSPLKKMGR